MIWSFAITGGFRKEIRDKVVGFGSHIVIQYFDNNQSYEKQPFSMQEEAFEKIARLPNVKKIYGCAGKAGVFQSGEEMEGVLFKGIGTDYPPQFFTRHLVRGVFPDYNDPENANDIIISEHLAKRLRLDTGDKVRTYFVQEPIRQRNFRIAGIYNTGLATYDETYAICSIRQIQKLNNWAETDVDAVELLLEDMEKMDATCEEANRILPYQLNAETARTLHPDMFDWISLFDQNVLVLVILITLVVCITLISTQLTITLEQIPTIGILQTLGCSPKDIRNIFLYISGGILVKGILAGNMIALIVCQIQQRTHLIRLDPKNYFMDYVPMLCQWRQIIGINLFVLFVSLLLLTIPAHRVAKRIRIVDAIDTK